MDLLISFSLSSILSLSFNFSSLEYLSNEELIIFNESIIISRLSIIEVFVTLVIRSDATLFETDIISSFSSFDRLLFFKLSESTSFLCF